MFDTAVMFELNEGVSTPTSCCNSLRTTATPPVQASQLQVVALQTCLCSLRFVLDLTDTKNKYKYICGISYVCVCVCSPDQQQQQQQLVEHNN